MRNINVSEHITSYHLRFLNLVFHSPVYWTQVTILLHKYFFVFGFVAHLFCSFCWECNKYYKLFLFYTMKLTIKIHLKIRRLFTYIKKSFLHEFFVKIQQKIKTKLPNLIRFGIWWISFKVYFMKSNFRMFQFSTFW